MSIIDYAERGWIPDWLIRLGIRRLLTQRLQQTQTEHFALEEFASSLRKVPLVVAADDANEQHYEVPAWFYERVLGAQLKYSAGYWPPGVETLDAAEEAMLALTAKRAELHDGQEILELGCGWGSLTLWMAERYPASNITAVSNSHSQRKFIEERCRERGLQNVRVITCNIVDLALDGQFDRVVSVEMFEHVRNYQQLLEKIDAWLLPEGKLFVHIFCHRQVAYLFEEAGASDWMTRNFFRGGMMPAEGLLAQFNDHLAVERQWWFNGQHYARTCEAWLDKLDQQQELCEQLFAQSDVQQPKVQVQRWRMFFMACAELFAYRQGNEWGVAHYLLAPVRAGVKPAEALTS